MKEWQKNIRKVEPYVPGEQPNKSNMIKLNTNENPYPPSPKLEKVKKEFQLEQLRLYPDPKASILVEELARYYQLEPEQIFVGIGSDDVLAMAFMTFFNSEKPILFPDITYSFYDVWANLFHISFLRPKLDHEFRIQKEDYYRENGGIVIANPNAPTSLYEGLDTIEDILQHNRDVIVIIDEAYIDFGGESARGLIEKYDNLLVVQTFSKSRSMAGMRIGYAMGNKELIEAMQNVKYSYNSYTMNQTALSFGAEVLKDNDYFKETLDKVISTRERVKRELKQLGFSFPDSKTNFIFATHEKVKAVDLYQALREQNIYVRYFNTERIDNYIRITVGTEEEMDVFLAFVKQYLGQKEQN